MMRELSSFSVLGREELGRRDERACIGWQLWLGSEEIYDA